MPHGRFDSPIDGLIAGFQDRFRKQTLQDRYTDDLRFDGQTVLITGASSGVGFATAVEMAHRGARVFMACRSGVPEKGEEVCRLSGSDRVEMYRVDLSDLAQVNQLADTLQQSQVRLDVVIENAGVASARARRTPQGLEAMFVTNYLAKFLLLNRLLDDGTIVNRTRTHRSSATPRPRVIMVSSDSHQTASAIDWTTFGRYREFGVNGSIHNYSYFKLILNTFAVELSRRLAPGGDVDVAVHAVCPGPVDTNIIRDAPLALRMVLRAAFKTFFAPPDVAIRPIVYAAGTPDFEGQTNRYLHMFNPKEMDEKCYGLEDGQMLWDRSVELIRQAGQWR